MSSPLLGAVCSVLRVAAPRRAALIRISGMSDQGDEIR